jgi:indole-3-glycerol phosphate synthase
LSVLIEIHDEKELQRVSKLKSKLLGINNRDLKTLKVNLETSLFLSEQISQDYVVVSESGIKDGLDIDLLKQAGINCFLIGEHFMRQKNIALAVKNLINY